MGSLVVKLDNATSERLKNINNYSDIDMLGYKKVSGNESVYGMPINADGGVPLVYDVEAVKVAVRNILMWRIGESILSPEFGHGLNRQMYSQLDDYNKQSVCEEIKRAIEENEPRVRIHGVGVSPAAEDEGDEANALKVKVTYSVIGQNDKDEAKLVEETTISGK